jgi:D-sedoheptulose 7-phosphate isomerase
LPAIALTTDTSFLTAFANDENFEDIFARQVQGLGVAGDVLIGISTSGGSKNVLRAFAQAKEQGMSTILLTGQNATGVLNADIVIAVPNDSTQHIQESHLAIEHIICDLVERHVFKKQ